MKQPGRTSTFVIHHDRCDPSKWTPGDVLTLAKFVMHCELRYAAVLSGLGVQLVTSEHHEPVGGTLQIVGWAEDGKTEEIFEDIPELMMNGIEDGPVAVMRIYRGPAEYAVAIPIGDEDGNFDGFEYEVKPTLEEARTYLAPDDAGPAK